MKSLFDRIKNDFCSLWKCKERGQTLEVITPYGTTTNKFVSVFLTKRKGEYIVSDGGMLSESEYEVTMNYEDAYLNKLFDYYIEFYDIKSIQQNEKDFFYKKTTNEALVPNLIFDLSSFITAVASAANIAIIDKKDREEVKRFDTQASKYIRDLIETEQSGTAKVIFKKPLDEKMKSVRFSAIITQNSHSITLINYVTGSNFDYFVSSIGKANITFEVAGRSYYKDNITRKIALINDASEAFDSSRLSEFLRQLSNTTKEKNVLWHKRNDLKTLLRA